MSNPPMQQPPRARLARLSSLPAARWSCGLALVIALASFSALGRADTLEERIATVTGRPEYKHAHWGMLFVDRETGEVLYEQNADKLFVPASTTKLFSVAAALDALGADYRFQTPVHRHGEVDDDGLLQGDLILIASGDLTFGGRTDPQGRIAFKDSDHIYAGLGGKAELTDTDPLGGLKDLARQVAAAGIKRVGGDVLIDDRLFEPAESTGSGPRRVTPIRVNDNLVDFVITPAEPGIPAAISWRPESSAVQVDARVETVEADAPTSVRLEQPSPDRFVLRGRIASGRKPLVVVAEVDDPASFARSLFIEELQRAGVAVEASPLVRNRPEALPEREACRGLPRVALHTSPPFSEAARLILKVSHNLSASTLPLLLAGQQGKRTLNEGLRRQHDVLADLGVDVETISFGGGAGGARADHTTPRATVQLLQVMAKRSDFPVYREALPALGVDGTLAGVVAGDSPARGKVQAKTGTLFWYNAMNDRYVLTSKALAGYMTSAGGREIAFALFVNNAHLKRSDETSRAGEALGRLCEIAYESW